MNGKVLVRVASAMFLLGLAIVACGSAEPTPEPTATLPPPLAQSPCGDGVCDDVEQKNPALCPQDCPLTEEPTEPPTAPPPTESPSPEPTEPPDKCGDGVCDEAEINDPSLCPQDCPTPTPEAAITVEVTPAEPTAEPTATVAARTSTTTADGQFALLGDPATVNQEGAEVTEPAQSNVALILDGSGSMGEALPGSDKTKLAVAKEVMAELIPQIPAELASALWIYAHRYPPEPKAESCKDIEQVFPLGPVDAGAYVDKIQAIKANGWTPIADSIIAAADTLPSGDFNSMILVSDGQETCGGDPCAVARALKESDTGLTVHVVGYAVDDETREELECIAGVSGGSYHDAADAEGLLQALEEALSAAVVETILRVEIVSAGTDEIQEDILLVEAGTDEKVSYYRTWTDNLVPPGSYDLEISTLPNLVYLGLELPEGSTTVARIILGAISVLAPDGEPAGATYYAAGNDERLGVWGHEGPVSLVPGTYYVTYNQSVSAPIAVEAGELEELRLGGILVLSPDGEPVAADFWDAATNERLGAYGHDGAALFVPGSYILDVYRSYTEPISVEAGQIAEVRLGAVHVDGSFTIWDAAGERLGAYGDTMVLVPGTYRLELADGTVVEEVVVEAGQVTEVP
jgi:hypothetical protein